MNDVMVSIRMPEGLLLRLRRLAEQEQFMDVSEEVRSIVRKRWMQFTNPELFELKRLREDIKEEVRRKSSKRIAEEVNNELERIKEMILSQTTK